MNSFMHTKPVLRGRQSRPGSGLYIVPTLGANLKDRVVLAYTTGVRKFHGDVSQNSFGIERPTRLHVILSIQQPNPPLFYDIPWSEDGDSSCFLLLLQPLQAVSFSMVHAPCPHRLHHPRDPILNTQLLPLRLRASFPDISRSERDCLWRRIEEMALLHLRQGPSVLAGQSASQLPVLHEQHCHDVYSDGSMAGQRDRENDPA